MSRIDIAALLVCAFAIAIFYILFRAATAPQPAVPNDGMERIGAYTYLDRKTGCEWIIAGDWAGPRAGADGKQVCNPVKP